jgi:hypothetical protein
MTHGREVTDVSFHYAPWTPEVPGWSIELANQLGAEWLMSQRGQKLILVDSIQNYKNSNLGQHVYGAEISKPNNLWKTNWQSGSVLAPWPGQDILSRLSDGLGGRAKSICVIPWGMTDMETAWLRAHHALDIITDTELADMNPLLSSVVEAAFIELGSLVNHSNGLSGHYERPKVISTLQLLLASGYRWDTDKLCAWALANGFSGSEVRRLRDYATKVLAGHTFRLNGGSGYGPGAVARWEKSAAAAAD